MEIKFKRNLIWVAFATGGWLKESNSVNFDLKKNKPNTGAAGKACPPEGEANDMASWLQHKSLSRARIGVAEIAQRVPINLAFEMIIRSVEQLHFR